MKTYLKQNSIMVGALLLLAILCIKRVSNEIKPYPTGDAIEYTLVTEAFYNHLSSEVRETDCESFKEAYSKVAKWEENEKAGNYDAVEKFIQQKNLKNLEYKYAFFVDKKGRKYSTHFWFYSLLNLPVRVLCAIKPFNPILVFHITNMFLFLISCFVFFKTSKYTQTETLVFCLLFFYSTNYWYFCWPHPEVFTVCFVTTGLWLFLHKKRYTGILLVSIAALQNQPLAVLTIILSLIVLFDKGFYFKNLVTLFLSSCLILAPPLFYFYHFGTTNLISYQGALSTDYITTTRIFGFFFDINQGMILALPLILLLYLFLYSRKLVKIKKAQSTWDLYLLPAIIIVVCGASTINNWNHGQATVNRYVTYVGAIVLLHFFYLVMELQNKKLKSTILLLSILSQMATILYHQKLNMFVWSSNQPKPLSNWVLSHFPSLYNPDPIIFNTRYAQGIEMDISESPTYFMKETGEITKFLVHNKYLNNLQKYGFSLHQIDSIAPTLKYINGWAYIDVTDELKSSLSRSELKKMDNERRIKEQIKVVKATPIWYEAVKKRGIERGIDEESALREDAALVLHIVLQHREKTKSERIKEKIESMKAAPSWLKLIEEKAMQQGISLDSALYNDAKWEVEQK